GGRRPFNARASRASARDPSRHQAGCGSATCSRGSSRCCASSASASARSRRSAAGSPPSIGAFPEPKIRYLRANRRAYPVDRNGQDIGRKVKARIAIGMGLVLATLGEGATSASGAPAYIGRVAEADAASLVPVSVAILTTGRAVSAGDALLIAIKLRNSLVGGIGATDAAGNTYRVDVDQGELGVGRTIV